MSVGIRGSIADGHRVPLPCCGSLGVTSSRGGACRPVRSGLGVVREDEHDYSPSSCGCCCSTRSAIMLSIAWKFSTALAVIPDAHWLCAFRNHVTRILKSSRLFRPTCTLRSVSALNQGANLWPASRQAGFRETTLLTSDVNSEAAAVDDNTQPRAPERPRTRCACACSSPCASAGVPAAKRPRRETSGTSRTGPDVGT